VWWWEIIGMPWGAPSPMHHDFVVTCVRTRRILWCNIKRDMWPPLVLLAPGQSKQLVPSFVSLSTTWSSSDTQVASVDTKGNVTAKVAGSAVITATASGSFDVVPVTVSNDIPSVANVTNDLVNASNDLANAKSNENVLSGGVIAGIVVGSFMFLAAMMALGVYFVVKHTKKATAIAGTTPS
jgi:hypothetical protein